MAIYIIKDRKSGFFLPVQPAIKGEQGWYTFEEIKSMAPEEAEFRIFIDQEEEESEHTLFTSDMEV